MNRDLIMKSIFSSVVVSALAYGGPAVMITADVPDHVLGGQYATDDVIPIVLQLRGESDAAIFGTEIEIATTGDDVAIRSVTVNPTFSTRSDSSGLELPASQYAFVCTQPADSIDHSLGAAGRSVELMTVELEVRSSAPFETTLEIGARVALIGKASTRTVIFHEETTDYVGDMARNRLTIINTGQPEQDVPWVRETADLSLSAYEPGGQRLVETLIAGRPYELHYASTAPGVCGYVLTTIAEVPGHGILAATEPATGRWADGIGFTFASSDRAAEVGLPAPAYDYPEGYDRYEMVASNVPYERWRDAPASGHLFNFVPQSAGPLILHVDMWWIDEAEKTQVAVSADEEFTVTGE